MNEMSSRVARECRTIGFPNVPLWMAVHLRHSLVEVHEGDGKEDIRLYRLLRTD